MSWHKHPVISKRQGYVYLVLANMTALSPISRRPSRSIPNLPPLRQPRPRHLSRPTTCRRQSGFDGHSSWIEEHRRSAQRAQAFKISRDFAWHQLTFGTLKLVPSHPCNRGHRADRSQDGRHPSEHRANRRAHRIGDRQFQIRGVRHARRSETGCGHCRRARKIGFQNVKLLTDVGRDSLFGRLPSRR